jgi:hypothetical protein
MTGSAQLWQIHERAFECLQCIEFFVNLFAQVGRESRSNALNIIKSVSSILPNDKRRKIPTSSNISADYELALLIETMLLPSIGLLTGEIDRIGAFRNDALQA